MSGSPDEKSDTPPLLPSNLHCKLQGQGLLVCCSVQVLSHSVGSSPLSHDVTLFSLHRDLIPLGKIAEQLDRHFFPPAAPPSTHFLPESVKTSLPRVGFLLWSFPAIHWSNESAEHSSKPATHFRKTCQRTVFLVSFASPLMNHNCVGAWTAVFSSPAPVLRLFYFVFYPVRFHTDRDVTLVMFPCLSSIGGACIPLDRMHILPVTWHVSDCWDVFTPLITTAKSAVKYTTNWLRLAVIWVPLQWMLTSAFIETWLQLNLIFLAAIHEPKY